MQLTTRTRPVATRACSAIAALWIALSLLAACAPAPSSEEGGAPSATPGPPSSDATSVATADRSPPERAPQVDDARVVLDLRTLATQEDADGPMVDAASARQVIEAVFGSGAPDDVRIGAVSRGAFTAPGTQQSLYLLLRGEPNAASPTGGPRPMLAVFQDDALLTQFVPEFDYRRLFGKVDADGNGTDELLLGADAYNMGQHSVSVHVLSLADGRREVLQRFDDARLDACENPVGERYIEAAVIARAGDRLQAEKHRLACGGQERGAAQ